MQRSRPGLRERAARRVGLALITWGRAARRTADPDSRELAELRREVGFAAANPTADAFRVSIAPGVYR